MSQNTDQQFSASLLHTRPAEVEIATLKARVAELEKWLHLAYEANRVLYACTDGYYRANEADEVKAWDAVEDAVKESIYFPPTK